MWTRTSSPSVTRASGRPSNGGRIPRVRDSPAFRQVEDVDLDRLEDDLYVHEMWQGADA